VYYGDELARPLVVPGAEGDANLRSLMNWDDTTEARTRDVLEHWRRLGRFRRLHPAQGAGAHRTLRASPLVFSRVLEDETGPDRVVVALHLAPGPKTVPVGDTFAEGATVVDGYSGVSAVVRGGVVLVDSSFELVLIAAR
jgi:alpha-amylase